MHSPIKIGVSVLFQMKPSDYPGGTEEKYQQYLSCMAELVRLLNEKMGAEVVIFSTVPWEDMETVNELLSRFEGNDRVKGAKIDSVKDAFEVTGSLDLLVSTRLHSLIFALAQGVPSIALSDQERIIGLYLDLEASDLRFNINDFNPEEVVTALERLLQGRGQQLLAKVRDHQAKVAEGLQKIVAEIGAICQVASR
jgi:polysaccharide pyruvyl transferase WcaK-like protein